MAYPRSFIRQTLRWSLPGGESANASVAWDADNPLVSLDDDTVAALGGRASSFWTAIAGKYDDAVHYIGCRVAWINTDGTTLAAQEVVQDNAGTHSGAKPLPNEVAHVMSLRTATSTRSTRGRMYLPGMHSGLLTDDARMATADMLDVANAAADYLADITVGATTFTSVVASATASVLTPVLAVAVGDVPDAQRRRRDKLREAYQVAQI